jgi:protein phosphatase 1 regulatory subunit 7
MILKKCFLINLLAVLAVSAVGVGAADVTLNGYCWWPESKAIFSKQTLDANDVVQNINISPPCNTIYYNIEFASSSIYYIPVLLFTRFPNILGFLMRKSNLREIRPNTFQNAKKLLKIELYVTNLYKLDADSFAGATSLQALLIYAKNTTIEINAFRGLSALTSLSLSQTYLPVIDQTTFNDTTKLKALSLDKSSISSIDPQAFSGLASLQVLNLKDNLLTSLDKNLLQNNSNLSYIDFSGNLLMAIDDSFFKNNPILTSVGLGGNQLENITDALFANTPLLKTLNLSFNRIKSLSSTVFQKLSNLSWLILSNNSLTSLQKDIFSNNAGLYAVYLDNNKLNAFDKTIFSNLTNLNYVKLENNTCINTVYYGRSVDTTVMDALVKCDANYYGTNSNSVIKGQLQIIANMLANASAILFSITNTFY